LSASALLDALCAAGVRVSREGEDLRAVCDPGVRLAPFADAIRGHKPAILAELRLRERIVAAATAPTESFDREGYDALWAEWRELQEV
jgi:anti-sigma-K factor RskA